jgi:hypothetical protein
MLGLSRDDEQGTNSSALQLADALTSAAVLAVGGALLAAGEPGPSVYLAGFAIAVGIALFGLGAAGRVECT